MEDFVGRRVETLCFDPISVVAKPDHASTHCTANWNVIFDFSLRFLFGFCAKYRLTLIQQSVEVQERMEALASAFGLREIVSPLVSGQPAEFPLRTFQVRIPEHDAALTVHGVPHPIAWWRRKQIRDFSWFQVCTPPPRLAHLPASGLVGPSPVLCRPS